MRTFLLAIAITVGSTASLPTKGDVVYVPLEFKRILIGLTLSQEEITIAPCERFKVRKVKSQQERFYAKDQRGVDHCFEGPGWPELIFKDKAECKAKSQQEGLPEPFIGSRYCYRVVEENKGQEQKGGD